MELSKKEIMLEEKRLEKALDDYEAGMAQDDAASENENENCAPTGAPRRKAGTDTAARRSARGFSESKKTG